MFSLNLKGNLFVAERVLIMGILNITPDSFFTSKWKREPGEIAGLVADWISNGLDILDIGGQSTRPGSERLDAQEELDRILPVIEELTKTFPGLPLSIDTYHSRVAEQAIGAGAHIINDISGGDMDADMIPLAARLGVPFICMHMQGRPEHMQENPQYKDVGREVLEALARKIKTCHEAGIKDVIIDPGFGFGKNIAHNFSLLRNLQIFRALGQPVLAGLSRKSTVYKTLNISPDDSLNGTTVLNTLAIANGADILRVHDVKEANEVRQLMEAYKKTAP